jgi:predicted transcriptional regulator
LNNIAASAEKELELLERINRSSRAIRQRELAKSSGLSLGMTNSILKRLASKGLLKIKKVNNRNIQYIVSPQGLERIARRGYRFLKRTIRNVASYGRAIDGLVLQVARRGFSTLLLIGRSDLDFLVEYACRKHGVRYRQIPERAQRPLPASSAFWLYSENCTGREEKGGNAAWLRDLLAPENWPAGMERTRGSGLGEASSGSHRGGNEI